MRIQTTIRLDWKSQAEKDKFEKSLDAALLILGYTSRAEWVRAMARDSVGLANIKKNPCPKCGDWDYYTMEGKNICISCGHDWRGLDGKTSIV